MKGSKMKTKLFTHTDLDGCGCDILLRSYELSNTRSYELNEVNANVHTDFCDYSNINQKVRNFINSDKLHDYDVIYITDISIDEELAKEINLKIKNDDIFPFIQIIDHHKTAEWLNEYAFASVHSEVDNVKQSGTSLFYKFLQEEYNRHTALTNVLGHFVEMVRLYDTWEWVNDNENPNSIMAKKLNDLLYIKGRTRFINDLFSTVNFISDTDEILLEINEEKIKKYIFGKSKQITSKTILNKNVGIVFANQYTSELGNELNVLFPEYDLIAIIGEHTISYRTIKEDIDVGKFAEYFGGGGHCQSAGNAIKNNVKNAYIDMIFQTNN